MENKQVPIPIDFFLKSPLYEKIYFTKEQEQEILNIFNFRETFDAYCPECNQHSIFSRTGTINNYYMSDSIANTNYNRYYKCSRDVSHQLFFLFSKQDNFIEKIGQLPSLATLNMYDVQKYSKVLDKKYFQELTKAIGLVSHGIGVGSFVYLRRIFESLINDSYLEAKGKDGWDDELYNKSRMAEKIDLLKNELPNFLVENKSMYGILSKGIHELTKMNV